MQVCPGQTGLPGLATVFYIELSLVKFAKTAELGCKAPSRLWKITAALVFLFPVLMGLMARWLLGVCMVMVSAKTSPGQQPRTAGCPCPKLSNHICSSSETVGTFWINQEADTFLWPGLVVWRRKIRMKHQFSHKGRCTV